jgi:exodeoxyribonuclease V alpha subunit
MTLGGHVAVMTLVGHAVISAGEWVTVSGEWVNDRTY